MSITDKTSMKMKNFATVSHLFKNKFRTIIGVLIVASAGFMLNACNKKCRSLSSTFSGEVLKLYDFKSCYVYATFDSVLLLASDTAFANYKKSRFINCSAELEPVDFSKNMIIGYKTSTNACNAAFHRNISIDTAKKEYVYTVTIETCTGCGTPLTSTNIVVAPQIPSGYNLKLVKK